MAGVGKLIIPSFLAGEDELKHMRVKKEDQSGLEKTTKNIKGHKKKCLFKVDNAEKVLHSDLNNGTDVEAFKETSSAEVTDPSCTTSKETARVCNMAVESGTMQVRKSVRKRKYPNHLSGPCEGVSTKLLHKKKTKSRERRLPGTGQQKLRPSLKPFKCDKCGTSYVINPMKRGNKVKTTNYMPSPRHKVDPTTKAILTLCNACGLAFDRPKKPNKQKRKPHPEERDIYLQKSQDFAFKLAGEFEESEATRLYCPNFKKGPCGCIQRYLECEEGGKEEQQSKVTRLVDLIKRAKYLRTLKCYKMQDMNPDNEPTQEKRGVKKKSTPSIGLGNGQKKSKEFQEFVLKEREILRNELQFCERGAQKILLYSNNFLHKKLKTDPLASERIRRQKGKAALGQLEAIEEMPRKYCCVDHCSKIASTHARLLQQWRDRAAIGQAEARRVLAEMLTPSGGNRSNCYRFITWVTGCSHSTIGKVNDQMRLTGGDREPPTHGLVKWWREHPKPKKAKEKTIKPSTSTMASVSSTTPVFPAAALVQPISILQAAANSAGLPAVIQAQQQQQHNHVSNQNDHQQQQQHQHQTHQQTGNVTLVNLNNAYPQGFIIPTALGISNSIALPGTALQHQSLQHQLHHQQLQQQIQLLQLQIIQQQQQIEQHQQQQQQQQIQQQQQQHAETTRIQLNQQPATSETQTPQSHPQSSGTHQHSAIQDSSHHHQSNQSQTLVFTIPSLQNSVFSQSTAPTMVSQVPTNMPVVVSWLSSSEESQQTVLTYVSTSQPSSCVGSQSSQESMALTPQLVIGPSPNSVPQIVVTPSVQNVSSLQLPQQQQQQQLSLAIKAAAQQDVPMPLHPPEHSLSLGTSHMAPATTVPVAPSFGSEGYLNNAENTYSVVSNGNITVSQVVPSADVSQVTQGNHDQTSSTLSSLQAVQGLYLTTT